MPKKGREKKRRMQFDFSPKMEAELDAVQAAWDCGSRAEAIRRLISIGAAVVAKEYKVMDKDGREVYVI